MRRRISYTGRARADFNAVTRWLTQRGAGTVARRRLAAIKRSISGLAVHPCRYSYGDFPDVREMPCAGGYRVLYLIEPDTGRNDTAGDVRILRVFGPGQSREPS